MKQRFPDRLARWLVPLWFAFAACGVPAATLDLSPDAVLGKPDLLAAPGGATSAASLGNVGQAAEDPVTGALWVVDTAMSRVLRYASAATFANGQAADLVLGQPDFTGSLANRGTVPAANSLNLPAGVAVDASGRVYVADSGNHRILAFKAPFANGMNATDLVGQPDYTIGLPNRGIAPASNTLSNPAGLAFDATGNLYVADRGNHRVLRYNAPARTGSVANAVFGQGGSFATAVAATTASGLNGPSGVAVDAAGNLWVADRGSHRVLRFDAVAGGGDATADLVLCQASFTTLAAATTAANCNQPFAVAVDGLGVVYVADTGNHRVLRYTNVVTGAGATAVAGQASFTAGTANRGGAVGPDTLSGPLHVAIDRQGDLLVSDSGNARLLRHDIPRGRAVPAITAISPSTVPRGGTPFVLTVSGSGFSGDSVVNWNGTPRTTQYLSDRRLLVHIPANDITAAGPFAVTVTTPAPGGGSSTLLNVTTYVRAPLDGVADRVLGQPDFTSGASLNPAVGEEQVGRYNAAAIEANSLIDALVSPGGRVFVSEWMAGRVLSWPSVTTFQNGQPADVILGRPDEFTTSCDMNAITASTLCGAYGLALDPAGSLYVSDMKLHRVLRFDPPFATGMAASAVFGQGGVFTTGVANSGGLGANSLWVPGSVAATATALFVHDVRNYRILVYENPRADFTADVVIGQASMTSVEGGYPSATRFYPTGGKLLAGPDGNLYFCAASESRVLRFPAPFTTNMAADLVIGQASFTASVTAVTATGLNYALGMAFDPAGNLAVADYGNHRVLRFEAPFSSGMAATAVLGQPDFVTNTSGTSATRFNLVSAVAFDRVGNLVANDYGNARVLFFDRPFAFTLDPAQDLDGDGIPDGVEVTMWRDPFTKDNDIFSAGLGSATLFAMQQYRDFLAREGDASGIAFWAGAVDSGTYSRAQVIDFFIASPEFAGFVAPVVRLYDATFRRVPDYAGLAYNAGLVRNGTVSLAQLADFFTASPEFAATYGALDDTQFVTLLYANVLGRAPDAAGLAGWVSMLAGGASRGSVLLGFSDSPEYQANMAHEVFVTMMYAGMLRRTPEAAGFSGWVAALDAGTWTREQVIGGFYQSQEYRDRFLP